MLAGAEALLTMALRIVVVILGVFVVHVTEGADDGSYTTRFDGIPVEVVLNNDRILRRYVDCALDKGPCTAEGRELKKRIPDALESDCSRCSEVQKRQAYKVLQFLINHKHHYWDQLTAKYDPDGIYRKKYRLGSLGENHATT